MTQAIYEKVEEYVRKKYFLMFKKKDNLIIHEHENFFTVKKHETASPLILGKEILS
jgi:hypothetical protein